MITDLCLYLSCALGLLSPTRWPGLPPRQGNADLIAGELHEPTISGDLTVYSVSMSIDIAYGVVGTHFYGVVGIGC